VCGIPARVVANTRICREHVAIELRMPDFPDSEPGQFLELRCGAADEPNPRLIDWATGEFPSLAATPEWETRHAFLRRPFSIADRWSDIEGHTHLMVISRTVGPGTASLEQLAPGDTLDATGPLGRGFDIPPAGAPLVLVGGGVGIPPLIYLARRLHDLGHRDVTMVFGATTGELLPVHRRAEPATDGTPSDCVELASGARYATVITTDDGSLGMRGVVTDALKRWASVRSPSEPTNGVVFACGPDGMLKAVAQMTREHGLACQVCIERNMGCGLGTCLSCIVRVRDESRPAGWRWALTCSDGPVFDPDQLCEYSQV
jgi:dihydroorotate dehydrogenase electron transfer subunit